jgi:hypothetical protein
VRLLRLRETSSQSPSWIGLTPNRNGPSPSGTSAPPEGATFLAHERRSDNPNGCGLRAEAEASAPLVPAVLVDAGLPRSQVPLVADRSVTVNVYVPRARRPSPRSVSALSVIGGYAVSVSSRNQAGDRAVHDLTDDRRHRAIAGQAPGRARDKRVRTRGYAQRKVVLARRRGAGNNHASTVSC